MSDPIAPRLFALDPAIRYAAVNRDGRIVEMEQHPDHPSHNPAETDRMEELLLNPLVLEGVRRRGEIDLGGVRFVVIRYGLQYQAILPIPGGHLSIGIEPGADPIAIAEKVIASGANEP